MQEVTFIHSRFLCVCACDANSKTHAEACDSQLCPATAVTPGFETGHYEESIWCIFLLICYIKFYLLK